MPISLRTENCYFTHKFWFCCDCKVSVKAIPSFIAYTRSFKDHVINCCNSFYPALCLFWYFYWHRILCMFNVIFLKVSNDFYAFLFYFSGSRFAFCFTKVSDYDRLEIKHNRTGPEHQPLASTVLDHLPSPCLSYVPLSEPHLTPCGCLFRALTAQFWSWYFLGQCLH